MYQDVPSHNHKGGIKVSPCYHAPFLSEASSFTEIFVECETVNWTDLYIKCEQVNSSWSGVGRCSINSVQNKKFQKKSAKKQKKSLRPALCKNLWEWYLWTDEWYVKWHNLAAGFFWRASLSVRCHSNVSGGPGRHLVCYGAIIVVPVVDRGTWNITENTPHTGPASKTA